MSHKPKYRKSRQKPPSTHSGLAYQRDREFPSEENSRKMNETMWTRAINPHVLTKSGQQLPLFSRKSEKNYNSNHHESSQMGQRGNISSLSEHHRTILPQQSFKISKEPSREHRFIDDIALEERSSSESVKDNNRRRDNPAKVETKQYRHPPIQRAIQYEDSQNRRKSKNQIISDLSLKDSRNEEKSEESQININRELMSKSTLSGPRRPEQQFQSIEQKFSKIHRGDSSIYFKSESDYVMSKIKSEKDLYSIRYNLQNFSHHINKKMERMVERFRELERKHISFDLYFEELKQCLSQRKVTDTETTSLSQAKERQYRFLITEYQSKIKQLKNDNDKIQNQLLNLKAKDENSKVRQKQLENRLKTLEKVEDSLRSLKKNKVEVEEQLMQANSKIILLGREKERLQKDLQNSKQVVYLEQSKLSEKSDTSIRPKNHPELSEVDIEQWQQKVRLLQTENKTMQKLLTSKKSQIQSLNRGLSDSRFMLQKLKEINKELQRQYSQVQKQKMEKDLQITQKICSINAAHKKKMKQFDNFKNVVIDCLEQVYRQMNKKIKKVFEGDLLDKNRTEKCQVYFKAMTEYVRVNQENQRVLSSFMQKQYGITFSDVEITGYSAVFYKAQTKNQEQLKKLSEQSKNLQVLGNQLQNARQEVALKQKQIQKLKIQKDKCVGSSKNSLSRNSGEKDQQIKNPSSSYQIQELSKKRQQISNLKKDMSNLLEESHKQYLDYEKKIVQLEIQEKKTLNLLQNVKSENKEMTQQLKGLASKENQKQDRINKLSHEKQTLQQTVDSLVGEEKRKSEEFLKKISKIQQENLNLTKKMKILRSEMEALEKTYSTKLAVKQKNADQLIQTNKKMTVELKLLREKAQFSKIIEETKEVIPSKAQESQQIIKNDDFSQNYKNQVKQLSELNAKVTADLQTSKKIHSDLKQELIQKDNSLQRSLADLRRKEEQIESSKASFKDKEASNIKIQQQYKKLISDLKEEKQKTDKLNGQLKQENEMKTKEINKLQKERAERQQKIINLSEKTNSEGVKTSDLQQRLSQQKMENQELVKMVNKREEQIEYKQEKIGQLNKIIEEHNTKQMQMSKELLQRQDYFKTSEGLMQKVINQNKQQKQELQKKETQILNLIKQREELAFRMSEDLDEKSDDMRYTRYNHENEIHLFKQQIEILEKELRELKQEIKKKEEQVLSVPFQKKKQNPDEQFQTSSKMKQKEEEIQNLLNRIDILEQQIEQWSAKLQDRDEEIQLIKKEKNKYFKILQQKYEYIGQLQQAIKIKINQTNQLKEKALQIKELSEQYQNEESLREEMESNNDILIELQKKMTGQSQNREQILKSNDMNEEIAVLRHQKETIEGQLERTKVALEEKYKGNEVKLNRILQNVYLENQVKDEEIKLLKSELQKSHKEIQKFKVQRKSIIEQSCSKSMYTDIEELQTKNRKLQASITHLHTQIGQLKSIISFKQEQLMRNQQLLSQAEEQMSISTQKQADLENLIQSLKESKTTTLDDLDEEEELHLEQQVAELEFKYGELIKELDEKEVEIYTLKKSSKQIQMKLQGKFEEKTSEYINTIKTLEKQVQMYQDTIIALTQKCQEMQINSKMTQSDMKKSLQNFIVSKSPGILDFDFFNLDASGGFRVANSIQERRLNLDRQVYELFIEGHGFCLEEKSLISMSPASDKQQIKGSEKSCHSDSGFNLQDGNRLHLKAMNIEHETVGSQYVLKLKSQLHEFLFSHQEEFSPSFIDYHSTSALEVLEDIKFLLTKATNSNFRGSTFLESLAFIQTHEQDFIQDLQPQLQTYLKELTCEVDAFYSCSFPKKKESETHKSCFFSQEPELQSFDEIDQCRWELKTALTQKQKLMRQVRQLNIEKKEDEEEIRKLIERLNDEQVKSEYNMKRLEELSAREMDQIKSESDRYMLSLNSLLKINDKILEICFSKNDLREDLQDCLQHLDKLCRECQLNPGKKYVSILDLYDKHRQLIAKGKGRK